ncbi:MAG: peptidoglycan-binding protein, partial [Pseudomonadota bacterium]
AVTVAENDGLVAAVPIVGEQVSQAVETVAPATSWLASNLGLALVLFGIAAAVIAWQIKRRRLHDAKTWRHIA